MRKTEFYKVLFLVFFWTSCAIFITIYDSSILDFKSEIGGSNYSFLRLLLSSVIVTVLGAFLLGSLEVLILSKVLRKKPFGATLIIKTLVYLIFIIFFVSLNIIYLYASEIDKPLLSIDVLKHFFNFITSSRVVMMIFYWAIACILALFVLQVNEKFGRGVLVNLLLGKYHQPKEENRIFMFLDLTSATLMAEKLGPHQYSSFLKDFFFDIDEAIYKTKGAVFQYVGDEVVIIWETKKGIEENNCIKFFFIAEEIITSSKEQYSKKYGVFPEFKAGLHVGKVIVTEVGGSKSEIAYHGDAINTAARICSVCNKYNKRFLLSAELISLTNNLEKGFQVESIGVCQLKGKENVVALFSIERKDK